MTEEQEIYTKSKQRVQKHGEVFTPRRIVNMMLDQPGVKEACNSLEATFLEPSAGEGAFLIEILERKLDMVKKNYNSSLTQYENYSLFALATLYGIELLEDNAQRCVMNMYKIYNDHYRTVAEDYNKSPRDKIYKAAQYIISKNIVQGNFLTKELENGEPIIFSEWKLKIRRANQKTLKVIRTEYSLAEISEDIHHDPGFIYTDQEKEDFIQLNLFEETDGSTEENQKDKIYRYAPCKVEDVYKEEMEELDELRSN